MTDPQTDRPARFVVGTGRCGSTLLSRMLGEHAAVTPIHEFFTGLDWGRRFAAEPMSGPDLADLLAGEQSVVTDVLARGHTADEIQYPFGQAGTRYRPGDPMPWLAVSMAPRLTDDPDALVGDLLAFASAQPTAPVADHYAAVFGWLTDRTTGPGGCWIERSGSSIDYVGDLLAMFPDARIVHIHRDGREAALSIRAHPFYRLALALLYDLFPADLLAADEAAAVTHAIDTAPPPAIAGAYWNDQVVRGVAALEAVPAGQQLTVRFEDVLEDPAETVERLARFFDLPEDPAFAARAAALVGPAPRRRFDELDADDRAALDTAVSEGRALLGQTD